MEKDKKEEFFKEKIKELEKKLQECEKTKQEYLGGWQRTRADFLNYKKEELERAEGLIKFAKEGMILKILSILDNFEIAEKSLPQNLKEDKNIKGLLLIKNQLKEFLKQNGVEEIKLKGKKFDPAFCEVIEEIEDKEKESGVVIEEIQKGYKINGRVLRPAKVKVAK